MRQKSKTLVIAYYWPPSSGGGLMRWFKMSKYWQDNNHELIIYTPDVKNPPGYDPSLETQIPKDLKVLKTPIWEPHNLYSRFMGKKEKGVYSGFINDGKENWKKRLSIWIRSNFFIPDARMFWIRPSIRHLNQYLKNNPVDTIITTGPPHSMHLIALGLKKKNKHNFKWIADFRDPWTDIDYADQLRLSKWAEKKHKSLEKEVFKNADTVVTVTWQSVDKFEKIAGKNNIVTITNGFDPADFTNLNAELDEHFSICYLGSMNTNRNPEMLWNVLRDMCLENVDFSKNLKIKLIGFIDNKVFHDISKNNLEKNLIRKDFMPHKQGLKELASSRLLLLMMFKSRMSKGTIPGKAYEYLAVNRPILALGEKGSDVERVLESSSKSVFFDFNDYDSTKEYLLNAYQDYKSNKLNTTTKNINQYSRKQLAQDYKKLIDKMLEE